MLTIGAPHGVRGAVRVNVYADEPLTLRRYNPFVDEGGAPWKLTSIKPIGKGLVATFQGVEDRNGAQTLRGKRLFIPRSRLPRPEPDEFYHVDLVGLKARTADGTPLGTVVSIADYGAGDIIEVQGKETLVLPFTHAVVPVVDLDKGVIVVELPAGLDGTDAQPRPSQATELSQDQDQKRVKDLTQEKELPQDRS
ncbi:MAG: ribosome maturation factor RimM [Pseudomonadota bacterium]